MGHCPHCGKSVIVSPILSGWQEIADFLGMHKTTVQGIKQLPVAKINGMIMSSRNALEVWLMDNMPR